MPASNAPSTHSVPGVAPHGAPPSTNAPSHSAVAPGLKNSARSYASADFAGQYDTPNRGQPGTNSPTDTTSGGKVHGIHAAASAVKPGTKFDEVVGNVAGIDITAGDLISFGANVSSTDPNFKWDPPQNPPLNPTFAEQESAMQKSTAAESESHSATPAKK